MKKTALLYLVLALAGCHRSSGPDNAEDPYKSSFSMHESTKNDMGRAPPNTLGQKPGGQMSQASPGQMGKP